MKNKIRRWMSDWRYKEAKKWLIGKSLDVGSEWYRDMFDVCCDIEGSATENTEKEDIENLTYKDNEFDTVCCLEVLEHTLNPVKAIKELKRVAKKRLIISVPLEPYFSLPRIALLLGWNKEHLTALTETFISHHVGVEPVHHKWFRFRWVFLVYDIK
ncbi:hypothetical protein LCGC14_0374260 [marine sediment metagenome]|uniref:Methyltransferase type 11 domain-containing protein n=1 Tax=marine sediment metagenome TaxID=412755 RepID=A0A0F9VRD3_9ZZZZ